MLGYARIPPVALATLSLCFAATPDSQLPPHRDGVLLVRFRPGVLPDRIGAILGAAGATLIKRIGVQANVINVGGGRVSAVIDLLKPFSELLYVEPDWAITPPQIVNGRPIAAIAVPLSVSSLAGAAPVAAATGSGLPNDTFVTNDWAASNTGQTVDGVAGTAGADQRTAAAWTVTTGTPSVVVAVLDTGIQYSHPDLGTNIWSNPGGVGGCPAATHGYNVLTGACDPMDDDTAYGGHGSHVAGIIGAVGNNGAGIAGVNWTTSLMGVKWVDSTGSGFTSDLISAMDWVITAKQAGINVKVVNNSQTWPGTSFSQALSDEIDLLTSNDMLFVVAAGNTSQNNDTTPRYPCSYNRPGMICVAATDQSDNLASFSNYGLNTVQLAAPGVNIYSTLRLSNYGFIDGCSMAAAQVSGAAALILARGSLTVSNLRSTILSNVDVLPSLGSFVATGGRLNVCKAVPGCSGVVTGIPVNSVVPVITGAAGSGAVLSVSTGQWAGAPLSYSYQWLRCNSAGANCVNIPGATSQSYAVLATADIGVTVAASVMASNGSGTNTAQSSPSAKIVSAASPFVITSSILDGHTIGGSLIWQATPAQAVNFVQFYIDGVLSQTSSTSPYTYNQGAGGTLDTTTLSNGAHVLGLRALGTDNRTYSFSAAAVTIANPPQNTAAPVISGTLAQGAVLTTSNGSWTNNPSSFSYAWSRCNTSGAGCAAISGATSNTYTATAGDAGFTLRSVVTATNAAGSASATSAATAVITSAPTITTTSLAAGQINMSYSATLSASGGAAPYTWSVISGALPGGLALAVSTGVISGTPSTAGTSNFTVQVKDANAQTASKALSITINSAPPPSIVLVQSKAAEGSGVASLSAAFGANNAAGNLIIAFVRMSSTTQTVTVTDSAHNTYAEAVAQAQSADGHQVHLFYARNIAAGANTVTVAFSATNNHPWIAIYEYSGLSTTAPLDRVAATQGSSATPASGPTANTSSANELIFAAVGLPASFAGSVTAGSGFGLNQQDTSTSRAANETTAVSSTGAFNGSFSLSSPANWTAAVATFRP